MRNLDEIIVQQPVLRVQALPGRTKSVSMPIDGDVVMGMREEIADHYNVPAGDYTPHATTLDYLIGAAAACMTGTFSGMLLALGQDTHDGRLEAEGQGTIVKERGVLRVQRIHVEYVLRRDPDVDPDEIKRAHDRHRRFCPIAVTLEAAVQLTSELVLIEA